MQAAAEALASRGWDRETVESLYRETHRLAGSSGLYRMSKLSRTPAVLEEIVKPCWTARPGRPPPRPGADPAREGRWPHGPLGVPARRSPLRES